MDPVSFALGASSNTSISDINFLEYLFLLGVACVVISLALHLYRWIRGLL